MAEEEEEEGKYDYYYSRENDIEKNVEFIVAGSQFGFEYEMAHRVLLNSDSLSVTICGTFDGIVRVAPSNELNSETQTTETVFELAPL